MSDSPLGISCPLGHQAASLAFHAKDNNRRITTEIFSYYRCLTCQVLFLSPIPSNLGRYYPNDYYTAPRSLQRLDRIVSAQRYQIEMVRRFVGRGRMLEIGPAYGAFAYLAKRAGFDVQVIEMDEGCCRYLTEVVGVRAIHSDDPTSILPTVEPQNVIALWQVLEHLPDPFACLKHAAERLLPGGILVIAAPNPDALQFKLLRSWWPHVDAPRHLQLIPVRLLVEQLAGVGLEPVLITTSDCGARAWNAFGWQRVLTNFLPYRWLRLFLLACGWVIGKAAAIFEAGDLKGSSYTVILRKANNA